MNIDNTSNSNRTNNNISKNPIKSKDVKKILEIKEMHSLSKVIKPEGNGTENSKKKCELSPISTNNKNNENVIDNVDNNNKNEEGINMNEKNTTSLKKNDTLLDEICDIASETTTTTSHMKDDTAKQLIKDLLAHSISSKDNSPTNQDIDYKPLLLSITEDENSSLNENFANKNTSNTQYSHLSYEKDKVNENIRKFLKDNGIINDDNDYGEISEEEDDDDEDMGVVVYDDDNDDEEEEDIEEYDDEYDEEEEEDDIETEFLDSEYEFDEYPGSGGTRDYELNKSLGLVTEENMNEYEYKNMIDVLKNLSYVVSKMRNERDTEKLSIKNFDSIMNEIKYSQKTCSEILLKAERISNKYSTSLKELNELQEKFKIQNEQYKEEIKQMNKKILNLHNDIARNTIKGKIINSTERWINIIFITIMVITIYVFLFLLMTHFNVQQYTTPFIDQCLMYCKKFSLNHKYLQLFNRNIEFSVNYLYNYYEHFILKVIDVVQNLKIPFIS